MSSPTTTGGISREPGMRGFTLIELMVAVAIVAILAVIAIPSYNDYIIRSHLVAATNGLSAAGAQMEQFFQDYRSYAQVGTSPNPPCATASQVGDFSISCVAPANPPANLTAAGLTPGVTASTYVIYAVSTASATAGAAYILDNTGRQWSAPPAVWGTTTCPNSWLLKRNAC